MRLILGKNCTRFCWGLCYSWPDTHCLQSKAPMIHCCQGKTLQSLPHIPVTITYYHPKIHPGCGLSISPAHTGVLGFKVMGFIGIPWGARMCLRVNPSGVISCSHGDQVLMNCRINEEIMWAFASVTFPWWHQRSDKEHLACFLSFVHEVTVLMLPDNFICTASVSNNEQQGLQHLNNWEKQGNNRLFLPNHGSPYELELIDKIILYSFTLNNCKM